ncbi:collagen-binding domain-containing protein [Companilactobacillus jidongensis]|uniref:collagen-binding domain-containing protein n=1 Tax=Companilactobacillus jidongensis TaxID=2486006 RepID=UPI000F79DC4B|nr:collagen-binding domain-containing protein [Companilactobacillus jidongensis]
MNNKKGTKWALSCVATSAAVLSFLVVSNSVLADDTNATQSTDGNNPVVQTQAASGQTTASSTATQTDPSSQSNYSATYAKINSQNNGQSEQQTAGFKSTQGQPLSEATVNAPVAQQAEQSTKVSTDNPDVKAGGTFANDVASYSSSNNTGYDLHPEDNELGYAAYFHIFANEAHLSTHTNGNVATGLLDGQVNFGTNIKEELLDYDVSYIQAISKIAGSSFVSGGDTRTNKIVFGNGIAIDVSNPNRPLVTYGDNDDQVYIDHLTAGETYQDKAGKDVYIDFADMFNNYLEPKSQELAKLDPSEIISSGNSALITNSQFPDQNNRVIDLMDMKPNTDNQIVIYLSPEVLQQSTPLTIRGLSSVPEGDTVIINVDTQGSNLALNDNGNQQYTVGSQIKVIYDDGSDRNNQETEYFGDNHLLWNFHDSTASDGLFDGNIDFNNTFQGSVLAPKAEVTVHHNLDGNIVADKVNIKGESHRWDLQDNVKDPEEIVPPVEEIQTLPIEIPGLPDPGDPGDNGGNWEIPGKPGIGVEEPGEEGDWETPGEPGIPATPWEPGDGNEGNTENPGKPGIDTEEPGNPVGPETPGKPGIDVEEPGNPDKPVTIPGEVPGLPEYPEVDTDGDGIPDTPEVDTDGDGVPDTPITSPSVEAPAQEVSNNPGTSDNKETFPQTSESNSGVLSILGLALMSFLGLFGYKRKQN